MKNIHIGDVKLRDINRIHRYADFGIQSIARNIFLKKQGCRTSYYMDVANFGSFFVNKNSNNKCRHHCFGFLYYDCFISWNDKASEYFEDSHCNFKNCINLGCFWSEHIRLIQEGRIKSNFKNGLYQQGYKKEKMKLISVFDFTFHDNSIPTYEDGAKFLEGILSLLEDLPDVFVVSKEKKSRDYHKTISDRFREYMAGINSNTGYSNLKKEVKVV